MTTDLQAEALAFLALHNTMSLATCGEEGPWAASVFFANDRFRLYFLSSPDTRHGRNLLARPRVAATVNADERDWDQIRGIQLEGTAELLADPRQLAHAMQVYTKKFPFVLTLFELAQEPGGLLSRKFRGVQVWQLILQRLYYLDNRRAFGQRTEVPLDSAQRTGAGRAASPEAARTAVQAPEADGRARHKTVGPDPGEAGAPKPRQAVAFAVASRG